MKGRRRLLCVAWLLVSSGPPDTGGKCDEKGSAFSCTAGLRVDFLRFVPALPHWKASLPEGRKVLCIPNAP